MGKLAFGELELSILHIVRELRRTSVREVYKALGSQGSYTTIMTVMSRMADKGALKREKEGKQYIYWAVEMSKISSSNLLKRFTSRFFGGKPIAMMSYLLEEDEELTEEDLKQIEQLIKKRRGAKRGDG